jgi:hypothetical protein
MAIILCSLSLAEDYKTRGYSTLKNYQDTSERGFFGTTQDDFDSYIVNLNENNLLQPPLIFDYNNDGIKEIIVSDLNEFKIFQNKELVAFDSIQSNDTILDYSLYVYEGTPYLLSYQEIDSIYDSVVKYAFNGTDWNYNGTVGKDLAFNDFAFNCDEETGYCVFVYTQSHEFKATSFKIWADDDDDPEGGSVLLQSGTPATTARCFPAIKDVPFYNKNNDNQYEFYTTNALISTIGANIFTVSAHEIVLNSSGHAVSSTNLIDLSQGFHTSNDCSGYKYFFTSPLITDVNLFNPLDMVLGANVNSEEFKMYSVELDGDTIDDYPELFNADGIIISNPMTANVFEPSHNLVNKDFCVLGYTAQNGTDLLCASEQLFEFLGLGDSNEFFSTNFSNTFDIDQSTAQNIVHATQHSQITTSGADLSEFLTPFGVYRINYAQDKFDPIFQLGFTDGILIDNDVEFSGRKDLIYLTENSIIYIDDKFENANSEIDGYTINPCLEGTWQENTTVQVTITPIDPEDNKVQARAILYYDAFNPDFTQDSNWSITVSSESQIVFSFKANQSIAVGTLRLMTRDEKHNATGDIIDIVFSVSDEGLQFGDCVTTQEGLTEDIEDVEDIIPGEVGAPCNTGEDCNTGLCEYGSCALKPHRADCTQDSDCLSGQCIDSMCSKPSLSDGLDQAVKQQFGGDTNSLLIVSLIIIIGITITIIIAGNGTAPALFGGLSAFFLLSIGFTIIGWLPVFILVGIILLLLVLVVFLFVIGAGGSG